MRTTPYSIPAPVGGWNTRDALDSMPPTDAVVLDNWFPTTGSVVVRSGYEDKGSTGMGSGNVDTLAEFHSGTTRHLIACANGNIYNATALGAATSLNSGFSSNQWQTFNFNGRLFLFNGADNPQDWDGTTLTATAWTGPTVTNLIGGNVFKNRIFVWEENSQSFWYAPVNAVTGALTEFPLSRVAQFGGNLIAMGTWTHDGGSGPDDYAVFIMSSGDVVVYAGTDPGDADAWALVGIYRIGQPVDVRGIVKSTGDLLILTTEDAVNLSEVLRTGQMGQASKLSGAINEAVTTYASSFGWQAVLFNKGNIILYNIPQSSNSFHQYAVNTLTGAACRFKGMDARCWAVYNNSLYFGGTDGLIYQFTGTSDDGEAIDVDGMTAWSQMGIPYTKMLNSIRAVMTSSGALTYGISVGYDFTEPDVPSQVVSELSGSPWNISPWNTSPWSASVRVQAEWQAGSGYGQSLMTRLRLNVAKSVSWLRTDYRLEVGRNL